MRTTAKAAAQSLTAQSHAAPVWTMPIIWCAVTTAIIAAGLGVTLSGGTSTSFGYMFELTGNGNAFRQGLAFYGLLAAGLGAAFMFVPKATRWQFSNGLAWTTFLFMVIGGLTMLVVPQLLTVIASGGGDRAEGLAALWAATWIELGAKLCFAGAIIGAATFLDAWFRARRPA